MRVCYFVFFDWRTMRPDGVFRKQRERTRSNSNSTMQLDPQDYRFSSSVERVKMGTRL
jgi:hypothetical protein